MRRKLNQPVSGRQSGDAAAEHGVTRVGVIAQGSNAGKKALTTLRMTNDEGGMTNPAVQPVICCKDCVQALGSLDSLGNLGHWHSCLVLPLVIGPSSLGFAGQNQCNAIQSSALNL
jgi:hypothetical protein